MFTSPATLIALTTDLLTPVTLASVWLGVVGNTKLGIAKGVLGALLLAAFTLGAAMAWYPPLAAVRIEPAPGAQVFLIVGLGFFMPLVLFAVPSARSFLRTVDLIVIVRLGIWRLVYGALLLGMGASGGLPREFFLTVALGDMLVGLWAIWIVTRQERVSNGHLMAWNIFGLMDLLHVLPLAILVLRPFILSNANAPTLNLLPLVGVPVFIAMHIVSLGILVQRAPSHGSSGKS
jgi:hypothetical protein